MSTVRDFMLEPGRPLLRLWRRDKDGDQWLPETPGIWRFKVPGFPWPARAAARLATSMAFAIASRCGPACGLACPSRKPLW